MNDVPIRDADGNKQAISTLETSPGKHTQRTIAQAVVGGAPVDVSAGAPLPVQAQGTTPVSGPLTDAQLRAEPLPIGVRDGPGASTSTPLLRASDGVVSPNGLPGVALQLYAGPLAGWRFTRSASMVGDTDNGQAIPPAAQVLFNGAGFSRARSANADGAGLPPTGTAAASPHVRGADGLVRPIGSASAASDTEAGDRFAPAGQMLYDQATGTWSRARLPYSESLLARAVRGPAADPATTAFGATSPFVTNRGFRGAIIAIRVWTAPVPQTNVGLSLKLVVALGGTIGQSTLVPLGSAETALIKDAGIYWLVVYPGATNLLSGPSGGLAPSTVGTGLVEWPMAVSSLPLPPRFAVSVHHRGGAAATGSWDYEVAASYIR